MLKSKPVIELRTDTHLHVTLSHWVKA